MLVKIAMKYHFITSKSEVIKQTAGADSVVVNRYVILVVGTDRTALANHMPYI